MNRRDLLVRTAQLGKVAPFALLMGSNVTLAQDGKKVEKSSSLSFAALIEASSKCVPAGMLCAKHCEKELAEGNKDMAECLQSVLELVSACENLTKLAALNSSHTREFAKLTAKICGECAKVCEKHAKHMEVCKNCMDACRECEKACLAA